MSGEYIRRHILAALEYSGVPKSAILLQRARKAALSTTISACVIMEEAQYEIDTFRKTGASGTFILGRAVWSVEVVLYASRTAVLESTMLAFLSKACGEGTHFPELRACIKADHRVPLRYGSEDGIQTESGFLSAVLTFKNDLYEETDDVSGVYPVNIVYNIDGGNNG